jgi:predicted GIY-YIG superfamily endonuclease
MNLQSDSQHWYVYIVRCADQTLYTGIAMDVEKRLAQHNRGKGAKYTRGRVPVELVFVEKMLGRGDALRREHQIKRMNLSQKQKLLQQ